MTTAPEQGYLDVGGVRTWHDVRGSGEPLVLLHGGMCTADTFDGLADLLAPSYRVHRPERRGHGRTPDVPGPLTYHVMADDTVAYLETTKIGPAHVVGWSDGAIVGLLAALARPELVRSLTFVGAALTEEGFPEEMRPLPPQLPVEALPPFLRDLYGAVSPDGPEHFDEVFAKLSPSWTAMPIVELDALAELDVPTLVVAAEQDMCTAEHAAAIAAALPRGRSVVVPGDHALPMEQPAVVAELVTDFLGSL